MRRKLPFKSSRDDQTRQIPRLILSGMLPFAGGVVQRPALTSATLTSINRQERYRVASPTANRAR
jgi:hypothetical protein